MNFLTPGANAFLDGTSLPDPLYVQLHIGNPGTNGTANVAATSTRQPMSRAVAAAGATSNDALVQWLSVPGTETITHATLWSAAVAGTAWFGGALNVPVDVIAGMNINIDIGELDLSMTLWT